MLDVRRIIDFAKEHARITTEQMIEITGLAIKMSRLDMQVAQRTGEFIRYGCQGFFHNNLEAIDFYLESQLPLNRI